MPRRHHILALGILLAPPLASAAGVRYTEVLPGMLVLGDPKDGFIAAARSVTPKRGYFDVVAHGREQGIAIKRAWSPLAHRFTTAKLARLIRAAGWNGKDAIRLISCHVGHGANSVGAQLAEVLQVPVLAPKAYVWASDSWASDGVLLEIQPTLGAGRVLGRDRYAYFVPGRGDLTLSRPRAIPAGR